MLSKRLLKEKPLPLCALHKATTGIVVVYVHVLKRLQPVLKRFFRRLDLRFEPLGVFGAVAALFDDLVS